MIYFVSFIKQQSERIFITKLYGEYLNLLISIILSIKFEKFNEKN